MYTEILRMPSWLLALLTSVFAIPVGIVLTLLLVAQPPLAGWLLLGGLALLLAVGFASLVLSLSRLRITVDAETLTIAFRILLTKRFPLGHSRLCAQRCARVGHELHLSRHEAPHHDGRAARGSTDADEWRPGHRHQPAGRRRLRRAAGQLGTPIGIASYRPVHAIGEDFFA